jgi:hypothetical protein
MNPLIPWFWMGLWLGIPWIGALLTILGNPNRVYARRVLGWSLFCFSVISLFLITDLISFESLLPMGTTYRKPPDFFSAVGALLIVWITFLVTWPDGRVAIGLGLMGCLWAAYVGQKYDIPMKYMGFVLPSLCVFACIIVRPLFLYTHTNGCAVSSRLNRTRLAIVLALWAVSCIDMPLCLHLTPYALLFFIPWPWSRDFNLFCKATFLGQMVVFCAFFMARDFMPMRNSAFVFYGIPLSLLIVGYIRSYGIAGFWKNTWLALCLFAIFFSRLDHTPMQSILELTPDIYKPISMTLSCLLVGCFLFFNSHRIFTPPLSADKKSLSPSASPELIAFWNPSASLNRALYQIMILSMIYVLQDDLSAEPILFLAMVYALASPHDTPFRPLLIAHLCVFLILCTINTHGTSKSGVSPEAMVLMISILVQLYLSKRHTHILGKGDMPTANPTTLPSLSRAWVLMLLTLNALHCFSVGLTSHLTTLLTILVYLSLALLIGTYFYKRWV